MATGRSPGRPTWQETHCADWGGGGGARLAAGHTAVFELYSIHPPTSGSRSGWWGRRLGGHKIELGYRNYEMTFSEGIYLATAFVSCCTKSELIPSGQIRSYRPESGNIGKTQDRAETSQRLKKGQEQSAALYVYNFLILILNF